MIDTLKIIGHINGENLDKITFIANEQIIRLGEMFIAVDAKTKDRFLLRVSDISYGQNFAYRTESARAYNQLISANFEGEHLDYSRAYQDDRPEQKFLQVECEYVGFIDINNNFGPPKHIPSYDSPVRPISTEDLDFMSAFLGDIPIGKLRSGSDLLNIPVGFFVSQIPYHMGVFAKTGGGKSNFVQRLIGGVIEEKGLAGILLLEPHGEYKKELIKHPAARENMVIFDMEGTERKLRISFSDLTVSDLMNIKKQMHWSEPQERFLREAAEVLGRDWFRFLVETPVSLDDVTEHGLIPSVLKDQFRNTFEDTIRVTVSKLKRIKDASFLNRDPNSSDILEIMKLLDEGKVVLVDMVGLETTQELLLSTILASKTLKRRKKLYNKDRAYADSLPPVGVILEEAQRVLNRDSNNDGNVFANICNEGRKFGVGLIPITQQPKNVDSSLMSQINTIFILGISDKKDFDALEEVAAKPIDKLRFEIRALQPGEAIITSPKSPFAIPVKIDKYDDYIKNIKLKKSNTASKNSFRGML